MLLKDYMTRLFKTNKKVYREFISFLIANDVYSEFNSGIALREKCNWSYQYSGHYCDLILNSFPWDNFHNRKIEWGELDKRWQNYLYNFKK